MRGAFAFEKWYADVLSPDGTVLLVYLAWVRLAGVRVARVAADLFQPGLPARSGGARAREVAVGTDRLVLGPATIEGGRLRFETPGLSGELRYAARHGPVALGAPLLRRGRRRIDWTVEVPDADVAGKVWWPGGSLSLAGRGYRDRVWMDLPPWSFPVRELEWGRIAAGPHASTWVRAATTEEAVTVGWLDGRAAPVGESLGELGEDRVLVESRAVDREGLRLGLLRPLFRRLSGDPQETKWACPATLRGERGSAIHERVRWR